LLTSPNSIWNESRDRVCAGLKINILGYRSGALNERYLAPVWGIGSARSET